MVYHVLLLVSIKPVVIRFVHYSYIASLYIVVGGHFRLSK